MSRRLRTWLHAYMRWALAAEPAAHGLELFDVVADYFDYGGDWDRQ
jgi:hypothetical protein